MIDATGACVMTLRKTFVLVLSIFLFGQIAVPAQAAEPTPKPVASPVDIVIPNLPQAFEADGKFHLVYELHIANLGKYDCALQRVEVLDGSPAPRTLAAFEGADLQGMVVQPGRETPAKTLIPPSGFAVVYMWVTVASRDAVPASIRHRIASKIGDYPEAISVETAPLTVDRKPVVVIAAPLAGDEWLAGNGPSNTSVHRRALIPIHGHAYISQRFAIDWVQLYPDGKTYRGDPKDNRSYRAYGTEIHAVAEGIVTQTLSDVPQNTPNEKMAVPMTLENIGGNHVIMDIGNGLYAFYAHMQPGSLRVKVGDKVRRGQVLGLLGNSGNSSEPHLHFHISNANSELGAEGMPYAYAEFEVQGKGEGWKSTDSHVAPVKHRMEIPSENEVVRLFATP